MSYRVGSNVDSWCTKCKLILAHTIEAVVGSDIKRVHCNTCLSKHQFKAHAPGEGGRMPRVTRSLDAIGKPAKGKKQAPGLVRANHYEVLMQGKSIHSARPYTIKDIFGEGEVMTHQLFGVGLVTASKGPDKIEVLFQSGPKTLVHRR